MAEEVGRRGGEATRRLRVAPQRRSSDIAGLFDSEKAGVMRKVATEAGGEAAEVKGPNWRLVLTSLTN